MRWGRSCSYALYEEDMTWGWSNMKQQFILVCNYYLHRQRDQLIEYSHMDDRIISALVCALTEEATPQDAIEYCADGAGRSLGGTTETDGKGWWRTVWRSRQLCAARTRSHDKINQALAVSAVMLTLPSKSLQSSIARAGHSGHCWRNFSTTRVGHRYHVDIAAVIAINRWMTSLPQPTKAYVKTTVPEVVTSQWGELVTSYNVRFAAKGSSGRPCLCI